MLPQIIYLKCFIFLLCRFFFKSGKGGFIGKVMPFFEQINVILIVSIEY